MTGAAASATPLTTPQLPLPAAAASQRPTAPMPHSSGITTFYDSVCGLPLFRAPMNRTLAEFKADTEEHGWPSFRDDEVVKENVRVLSDGETDADQEKKR